MASATFFCAARSGALNQSSTRLSSLGSVGQPNQAFSPLVRSGPLSAGDSMSGAEVQVWNIFQPPLSIGSFEARRVINRPQTFPSHPPFLPPSLNPDSPPNPFTL